MICRVITSYSIHYTKLYDYHKALSEIEGISFMPEIKGSIGNRWLTTLLLPVHISPETLRLSLEAENIEPAIFLFKDFHPFMAERNFAIIRRLREVSDALKNSYKTLILVTPHMRLADDLEKDVTVSYNFV